MATQDGVMPPKLSSRAMSDRRNVLIGVISFLTLVDLFATQAILPTLAKAFGVGASQMGLAVNASTLGMAIAGVAVAWAARGLNRWQGIWIALAVLAIPTVGLALTEDLTTFAVLRICQGLCMSTAFTLTMAYLAEHCTAEEAAGALAAYVTGNVASNLFGRMLSASLANMLGLSLNFYFFAALNLVGAAVVYFGLSRTDPMAQTPSTAKNIFSAWAQHLRNPPLRAAFAIGFVILFAFIGTFTYINFELMMAPFDLRPMQLGLVYLIFIPALITTPWAGTASKLIGVQPTFVLALGVALGGLLLSLTSNLNLVLCGLGMVAAGTFFAQAAATGFVGRAALTDRGAASGLYLSSYYVGGLVGTALLGVLYQSFGWTACVAAIAASLCVALLLVRQLKLPS